VTLRNARRQDDDLPEEVIIQSRPPSRSERSTATGSGDGSAQRSVAMALRSDVMTSGHPSSARPLGARSARHGSRWARAVAPYVPRAAADTVLHGSSATTSKASPPRPPRVPTGRAYPLHRARVPSVSGLRVAEPRLRPPPLRRPRVRAAGPTRMHRGWTGRSPLQPRVRDRRTRCRVSAGRCRRRPRQPR
jgi:hypothetical protein